MSRFANMRRAARLGGASRPVLATGVPSASRGVQRACWLAAVAAVFGLQAESRAQTGAVRGVVYDKDDGSPLPGATVQLLGREESVQSGAQGNYLIQNVPIGTYQLVFSKDGYVRQLRDVVITAGQPADVDIALAGDYYDMDEFVVEDVIELNSGSEAALIEIKMDSDRLLDSIGADFISKAGASDAAGALKLVAGATVKDGKSAVIRGLPDRYVSSQLNGVRLPSADADKRAVELDQFPSAVIQTIQVAKTFTPDQQGDASGGAVDVRLRGVPEDPLFVSFRGQAGHNTQVTGRGDFLSYDGGGIDYTGKDDGRRRIQFDNLGDNWDGAVGVRRESAPVDYKWSTAIGGGYEIAEGVRAGAFASFFYERDSSFFDSGREDSLWVESAGQLMTPKRFQDQGADDFKTALFDVSRGSQQLQWGSLFTAGIETENNQLTLAYLYTRTVEDSAVLAEDTRGKEFYFPGHDPDDPSTPGHDQPDAATYLRTETLTYSERRLGSVQLAGRHTLPVEEWGILRAPTVDWTVSKSNADSNQPDKRQFGSQWTPARSSGSLNFPQTHRPYKPAANINLGNLQRIWQVIEEDSEQFSINLELPFVQWDDVEGKVRAGVFRDDVERTFNQDTFSNFGDNSSYAAPWDLFWSREFRFTDHPIVESEFDVDYRGNQLIESTYVMLDLPLTGWLNVVGGVRWEDSEVGIVNDPERDAIWFPPGTDTPTELRPGDADVVFEDQSTLPAVTLIARPLPDLTLRASYAETIARQTFKELSPILQQEFLGGPIFIGNPDLVLSKIENYDLRADYVPYQGGLFSVSWFKKDLEDPIEYVQRVTPVIEFTTALNYPGGEIEGWELETRQGLGQFFEALEGLNVGANATFIDSQVTLTDEEIDTFIDLKVPITTRNMTNAPDQLLNLFVTYDIPTTGTSLSAFYTVTGDTLLAGAGESNARFIPDVYLKEFETLNVTLSQDLGNGVNLRFQAKNLTNPSIEQIHRSVYIGPDVTRSTFKQGIDYSIAIGSEITF